MQTLQRRLSTGIDSNDKEVANVCVREMKRILFGDGDEVMASSEDENKRIELVKLSEETELMGSLAKGLHGLDFEVRKDAVLVFNNLLRREKDDDGAVVGKVVREGVLNVLILGYGDGEIALNCGSMLRECLKYERLAKVCLASPHFWKFFEYVELDHFDVASDAFETFKSALTKHVEVAAAFMESQLDRFVDKYNKLLSSQNYVTRRQSLKLLGEMLFERANYNVLKAYIAGPGNLKLIMTLLLDNRSNIQYESFHVFRIFVANPNKTQAIRDILLRNKEQMLTFFESFLADRDDPQFQKEKQSVVQQIEDLT